MHIHDEVLVAHRVRLLFVLERLLAFKACTERLVLTIRRHEALGIRRCLERHVASGGTRRRRLATHRREMERRRQELLRHEMRRWWRVVELRVDRELELEGTQAIDQHQQHRRRLLIGQNRVVVVVLAATDQSCPLVAVAAAAADARTWQRCILGERTIPDESRQVRAELLLVQSQ